MLTLKVEEPLIVHQIKEYPVFKPHPDGCDRHHEKDSKDNILYFTFFEETGNEKMTVAINSGHINGGNDKAIHDSQREAFKLAETVEKNYQVRKRPK